MPRPYFLIVYNPPRPTFADDASEAEAAVIGEHFDYLKRLLAAGQLVMAGRTGDASMGLAVLEAEDRDSAEAIMAGDPAVKAGIFSARLYDYRLALLRE